MGSGRVAACGPLRGLRVRAVVFGRDEARAEAVARRLAAGMIGINRGVGGAPGTPWVGAGHSGYGYHKGVAGHRQFTQVRVVSQRKG